MNKVIIVSAVNFDSGGPLRILQDCINSASNYLPAEWKILVFTHNKSIRLNQRAHIIQISWAKKSWLLRLYVEFFLFKKISLRFKPEIWLSLHDITPNVVAKRRVVYCHNPSPFYRATLKDVILDAKFLIFNFLYKFVYKYKIINNYAVIVQQNWMKDCLLKLTNHNNIIVARPHISDALGHNLNSLISNTSNKFIFIYPAFPRIFKNFEIICEAFKKMPTNIRENAELRITISGNENLYAKYLYFKYKNIDGIKFIGLQNSSNMERQYAECDVLVFPSKLETWGLPISEAKKIGKPMLLSELPYARETVADYDRVEFIDPLNANCWSDKMIEVMNIDYKWGGVNKFNIRKTVQNWNDLLSILIYKI